MTKLPEPNACAWCNEPKQGHGTRWVMGLGFHHWIAPTNAMRKRRMLARRAARPATACYRCQLGDPHEVHATAEEVYGLRATEIGPSWDTVRHFLVEPAPKPGHDDGCESEFIIEAAAWSPCRCAERRADPLTLCPFCHEPTAGPLAGCDKPECQRREIEIEAAFKRLEDI